MVRWIRRERRDAALGTHARRRYTARWHNIDRWFRHDVIL